MGARWRDERGQAMVLVALGVIVLLGALALAVDFGYGLTQRRVMQTASDSAALAVGRYLATNVVQTRGEMQFTVTEAGACEVARQYIDANDSFSPQGHRSTFTVAFAAAASTGEPILPAGAVPFIDPVTGLPTPWEVVVRKTEDCAGAATTLVRPDVRYVHVFSEISYRSLVSGVLGFPTTTASASARAKVFGTPVPAGSPVWPMVRHYDKSDFNSGTTCPPAGCDPTDIQPTTFWSPNEDDVVYGNFKGMVDLSEYSPRLTKSGMPGFPQLISAPDVTGSPPDSPLKVDTSGNCPGGWWDTRGGQISVNKDKQCSIPNWFYYAFGGSLSLTSNWVTNAPPIQKPHELQGRSVCDSDQRPAPAPSCDDGAVGDWVEVANSNVGDNESSRMIDRIQRAGFVNSMSSLPVDPNKPNGTKYGKALVVLVYLWDCAESYTGGAWVPIDGMGGDCSAVRRSADIGRVHLFTVAPFTFYENLVSSSSIQGFWGGVFGDVTACEVWTDGVPMCDLNPLANSAALVADDGYDGP